TILNAVRLLSIRTRLTVISAACSLTIIINPTDDSDQRHGELHIQRNSRQRRQLRTQFLRCDWDIYMIVSWVQAPWHSKMNVPASITVIVVVARRLGRLLFKTIGVHVGHTTIAHYVRRRILQRFLGEPQHR